MSLPRSFTLAGIAICAVSASSAVRLNVTIVDDDGRELPSVTVTLLRLNPSSNQYMESPTQRKSNERGEVHLSIEESGLYKLRAFLPNFVPTQVGPFLISKALVIEEKQISLRLPMFLGPPYGVNESKEAEVGRVQKSEWQLSKEELDRIKELILRDRIEAYDEMSPKIDDPSAEHYCLAFEEKSISQQLSSPWDRQRPHEGFIRRFADHPRVHALDWCRDHEGRLLSAGPVELITSRFILMWSFSWTGDNPGSGSDCLHMVIRNTSGWQIQEGCLAGMIYN